MKKLILVLIAVLLLSTAATVKAHTEGSPFVTNLIADGGGGTGIDVGDVKVWNDNENLYVTYVITSPGWELTETNLSVATSLEGIPHSTSGNPNIGHFQYSEPPDDPTNQIYIIPLDWPKDTELFIAAHAVVEIPCDLEALELALPDQATMSVTHPFEGGPAYFPQVIINPFTGPTFLDGVYPGWCVNTHSNISVATTYIADVYSSYDNNVSAYIVNYENIDLVNWILNNDYVGKPSGQPSSEGGYEAYTFGDVQQAIWILIDRPFSHWTLYSWSQERVDEIIDDAIANGQGFVPGCDDFVGIILIPLDVYGNPTIQPVIIKIRFGSETAWGAGLEFPGSSWAMYFNYTTQGDYILTETENDESDGFKGPGGGKGKDKKK